MSFAGIENLSEIPNQYDQIPAAELVESFDWSSTSLGPMEEWEPFLKSTVVKIFFLYLTSILGNLLR
jgi:hypothetical protein